MSQLVQFYLGEATDTEGRTLAQILDWDDDSLEAVHDFVQWLFPLPEPSRFNPDAPLLTRADIEAFAADPLLRHRLRQSFDRFLPFLGLTWQDERIVDGPNLAARAEECWNWPNHNWLRVSRVLRSLTLLGLPKEAKALYTWLIDAHRSKRYPIGDETFRFWTQAVGK